MRIELKCSHKLALVTWSRGPPSIKSEVWDREGESWNGVLAEGGSGLHRNESMVRSGGPIIQLRTSDAKRSTHRTVHQAGSLTMLKLTAEEQMGGHFGPGPFRAPRGRTVNPATRAGRSVNDLPRGRDGSTDRAPSTQPPNTSVMTLGQFHLGSAANPWLKAGPSRAHRGILHTVGKVAAGNSSKARRIVRRRRAPRVPSQGPFPSQPKRKLLTCCCPLPARVKRVPCHKVADALLRGGCTIERTSPASIRIPSLRERSHPPKPEDHPLPRLAEFVAPRPTTSIPDT